MSDRSFLEEISIRNLGVIEHSSLELNRGLNVLTGETGAGKTMILTALSLVLGGKSDSSLVRTGSERLVASAQFSLTSEIAALAREAGAEVDEGSLILTRSVTTDGKSKAIAGGITVTVATLAQLGTELIEIHGQGANTQIVKASKQRELIDSFAGQSFGDALHVYQISYETYLEIKARIKSMKANASKRGSEIAELEEFLTAWIKLKAVRSEYSATNEEIARLSSVEDLRIATAGVISAVAGEESGALTLLVSARKYLEHVKGKDRVLDEIAQTLAESFFLLDDASRELASYLNNLEADPVRLDFLHNRKSEINTFLKRWAGGDPPDDELIALAAKAKSGREIISDLQGGDDRISELEEELVSQRKKVIANAHALTRLRNESALTLASLVSEEIHALAMPHTQFLVAVQSPDYQGDLKESDFTTLGCDEISMHIQSHIDGPMISLGKGASGGEMSRIMLALEVVIAKTHPVGTYIFDEVDAGVGGKAAIEVGRRLHQLAQHAQVIVVTHLPQVAAWADAHFVVKKNNAGSVVAAGVRKLDREGRIEEIARMLAGIEESVSAREHAAELLALRR